MILATGLLSPVTVGGETTSVAGADPQVQVMFALRLTSWAMDGFSGRREVGRMEMGWPATPYGSSSFNSARSFGSANFTTCWAVRFLLRTSPFAITV
jgi:hypothetical protein